ncbi:MAG TPA: chemotaxis protein CheW [Acidobacteriota bacterium]|nr:chemotaxis protein CheW [Acidobacteriota bacterium]
MVDMVEARKRAKKNREAAERIQKADADAEPSQAKPVLRSETPTKTETSYFPIEPEKSAEVDQADQQHVPAESLQEDQVDFLHKLMMEHPLDDEIQSVEHLVPEEQFEVLVFQLGGENYGVDIQQIAEIIRFVEPTEIPNSVAFLDGIISLRGRMIPVINGRKRLGHDLKLPDRKSRIVVLQEDGELQGILVDSASQVLKLPKKDIEPTPLVVEGVDAEFIEGVCEYKKQLIILLSLAKFLQMS